MADYWWCGWRVPDDIDEEHVMAAWPAGMCGACTGNGDYSSVWVGAVIAVDAAAADDLVRSCYGESAERIASRWEPIACSFSDPLGDRFPSIGGWIAKQARQRRGE